jgi:hypothetical protein
LPRVSWLTPIDMISTNAVPQRQSKPKGMSGIGAYPSFLAV